MDFCCFLLKCTSTCTFKRKRKKKGKPYSNKAFWFSANSKTFFILVCFQRFQEPSPIAMLTVTSSKFEHKPLVLNRSYYGDRCTLNSAFWVKNKWSEQWSQFELVLTAPLYCFLNLFTSCLLVSIDTAPSNLFSTQKLGYIGENKLSIDSIDRSWQYSHVV